MSASLIEQLEDQGQWNEALKLLKEKLLRQGSAEGNSFHQLGRLYQRLGESDKARRAYLTELRMDPNQPRTLNNLALLELNELKDFASEKWVLNGLKLPDLNDTEFELLSATACDLRLFQLKPKEALEFVERQLHKKKSVIGLANKAVCLNKLNELSEAVSIQREAIYLHLKNSLPQFVNQPLIDLIRKPCGDLESSIELQVQLMNLGIFLLNLDLNNSEGLKLLMSGTATDPGFWLDSRRQVNLWDGQFCNELIIWDDQGFGDTIQNIYWLNEVGRKVGKIRLWLRKSLLELVKDRFVLPENCELEIMYKDSQPWDKNIPQLGIFFLPIILESFKNTSFQRKAYLSREHPKLINNSPQIGLVWSAGRHSAPQPERSARARDVPFNDLWELAKSWQSIYGAELFSLQLEVHNNKEVEDAIASDHLISLLHSSKWTDTAEVLETLDLLITVDTSVAHLAGAMGIPSILILSCPSDWRWGNKGIKTFLYESFEVVRCLKPGVWSQVIMDIDFLVHKRFQK